jgi:UDP-N-acetylmuramate--alanine ligase
VKRRLEVIGEAGGVTVMSDYGHHPTEIRATLSAVRECCGSQFRKMHVLFQPHRYSRTQLCWNEYLPVFRDADNLILTEIYAASEKPIHGVSGRSFFEAVDHPNKEFLDKIEDAPETLLPRLEPGDLVLCLGAGSVGAMPEKFLRALEDRVVVGQLHVASPDSATAVGA